MKALELVVHRIVARGLEGVRSTALAVAVACTVGVDETMSVERQL